nr:hypothetical protein [Nonomuraea harbinensis]
MSATAQQPGQRAGSDRQEASGLGHRADADGGQSGDRGAGPGELVLQEPEIEAEMVRHGHPPPQQTGETPGDLLEGRRVTDVGGGDAVDALRSQVASVVDQGAPFAGDESARVEQHDADLDDPVVP